MVWGAIYEKIISKQISIISYLPFEKLALPNMIQIHLSSDVLLKTWCKV